MDYSNRFNTYRLTLLNKFKRQVEMIDADREKVPVEDRAAVAIIREMFVMNIKQLEALL